MEISTMNVMSRCTEPWRTLMAALNFPYYSELEEVSALCYTIRYHDQKGDHDPVAETQKLLKELQETAQYAFDNFGTESYSTAMVTIIFYKNGDGYAARFFPNANSVSHYLTKLERKGK